MMTITPSHIFLFLQLLVVAKELTLAMVVEWAEEEARV